MEDESASKPAKRPPMTFRTFLEREPVGSSKELPDLTVRPSALLSGRPVQGVIVAAPQISLYCPVCDAELNFRVRFQADIPVPTTGPQLIFLTYWCNNCGQSTRDYALKVKANPASPGPGEVLKIGEHPVSSEKLPNRLLNLVGEDRDLFLKGWRAEREHLGIGAFSYYRRVVENQKSSILEAVAKAAERTGDAQLATEIRRANTEPQFTAAVDRIKRGLPESLRVGGHNPLTVLYSALSDGLHNKNDAHCLAYAETVREVLAGLAERIAAIAKDESKLREQIGRLLSAVDHKDGE